MNRRRLTLAVLCAVLAIPVALAAADEARPNIDTTTLAYRQKYVREQFNKLTRRMLEVADLLAESDPASAAAIRKAVAEASRTDVSHNMGKVAGHLEKGLSALAGSVEKDVLADLKRVLNILEGTSLKPADIDALKDIRGRLVKVGEKQDAYAEDGATTPEGVARRAAAQKATAAETSGISGKMKDLGEKTGAPTPGQKSVDDAEAAMRQAGKDLERRRLDEGQKSQVRAAELIRRAISEIDDAILLEGRVRSRQLAANVEKMLREILAGQRIASAGTLAAHGRRATTDARKHALALRGLSDTEGKLGAKVDEVLALLKADGTTTVFPAVLKIVREDLAAVQKRLADRDAGLLTQGLQKQIESLLESMIKTLADDARRRAQRDSKPTDLGIGDDFGDTKPPPVSLLAELKMLRAMQARIKTRTVQLDAAVKAGDMSRADAKTRLATVAQREARLVKLTRELHRKGVDRSTPP